VKSKWKREKNVGDHVQYVIIQKQGYNSIIMTSIMSNKTGNVRIT